MVVETIKPNSQVLMHMIIRLNDGSIAENTRRTARPSKVILGDQSISAAFEKQLIGLAVGDKKEFKLEAADAFGESLEKNILTFPRDQFATDIEVNPGVIIEFKNKDGSELLGVVKKIVEDKVIVDFNHPLVGCSLLFDVEILEIHESEN